MGRAPGTRPAFVDQLWADAVATWKAAEDGESGASVTAAAHKAGRAFWNPASALRVTALTFLSTSVQATAHTAGERSGDRCWEGEQGPLTAPPPKLC